jgi:hypothetical protein
MKGEVLERRNGVWQRVDHSEPYPGYDKQTPNRHSLMLTELGKIPANTPRPFQNGTDVKIESPRGGDASWWTWLIPLALVLAVVASAVYAVDCVVGPHLFCG